MRCHVGGAEPGVMTQEEGEALAQRIFQLVDEPCDVRIGSHVAASAAFARGDSHLMKQSGGLSVQIMVRGCAADTTRVDDEGLKAAIAQAKDAASQLRLREAPWTLRGPIAVGRRPKTFHDELLPVMTPGARAEIVRRALDATEAAGVIGAGDLTLSAYTGLSRNTDGFLVFTRQTYGEFSLTARTKDGRGSGWGWSGFEDWSRVGIDAVIARAIDLAQRSANPVAVEPGRYTVILEPAALATLVNGVIWNAQLADQGGTPFSKDPVGTNKIGFQMLDRRLHVVADPWDPDMPRDLVDSIGDPVQRTVWFEKGVLRELDYDSIYAARKGRQPTYPPDAVRWYGEGPRQSLEEMIASTKRGIWVNRLSNAFGMNRRTGLLTGTTRDGTFLIENGKITKAVKNFRFTESPFFVLNKVEAVGEPVRASRSVVAPRIKVRDFDFTSLTDAV